MISDLPDGRHSVLAPAKLNLFLEVLGKRPDGFHELETLMVPVSLYDVVVVEPRAEPVTQLTVVRAWDRNGADEPEVPTDGRNLVVRAANLLRERAGIRAGVCITLVKRILPAAGLAGGSSDAAATLRALNRVWKLDWPRSRLAEVAAELGSDVPFFLGSGPAVCRGRGERVEAVRAPAGMWFVVARPPVGLSTADVYRACRPAESPCRAGAAVAALERGSPPALGRALANRLEPAAASLCPWIARLRAEFARLDLPGHQMSGSGTSYFGVCLNGRQARQAAARLRARRVGFVAAVRSVRLDPN